MCRYCGFGRARCSYFDGVHAVVLDHSWERVYSGVKICQVSFSVPPPKLKEGRSGWKRVWHYWISLANSRIQKGFSDASSIGTSGLQAGVKRTFSDVANTFNTHGI